ncbi:MAG: P-loop NTPase fold protein [bacterium]|nr:P-loop NTPase fold protein [bacterium]
MWSDNAATVDLLGYEDLVHEIVELAQDEALQPLTIGAFADWGAGKSTLLNLAADSLRADGALVVEFSPWLVEGYDDVKTCLLSAVVETIHETIAQDTQRLTERVKGLVAGLREKINWLRLAKLGASVVGPAVATPGAEHLAAASHIIPIVAAGMGKLPDLFRSANDQDTRLSGTGSAEVSRGFHAEFGELVASAEGCNPVVVLIDDLDRCLPEQVIETLEAIRLFLSTLGTAFVVAADERLVRDAVRRRYESAQEHEVDLPREYLEKLVHVPVRIPPLSRPEIESYCNLLVAQRVLDPDDFDVVLDAAQNIRRSGELHVSCNVGIARDALSGDLPSTLEAEFGLIEHLIGPLAAGLKGNPRQIKRYLNTLDMRRRTARRRGIAIDDSLLAKLVVLEYVRPDRHRDLDNWQRQGVGLSEEIAVLEGAREQVAGSDAPSTDAWTSDPWILDWLKVVPMLAGVDLAPYFFLSRDRAPAGGPSSRLPPALQSVLADLTEDTASVREPAVDKAKELPTDEQRMVLEACAARLKALTDSQPAIRSMISIAAAQPVLVDSVISALKAIPHPRVPSSIPLLVVGNLASDEHRESVLGLLTGWEKQSTSGPLSRAALQARKRLGGSRGDL